MATIFVKRGSKISGPYSEDDYQKLLERQKLKDGDLVSESRDGPYLSYQLFELGSQQNNIIADVAEPTENDDPPVTQWEYIRRMIPAHIEGQQAENLLNELGWEGWELVGISNSTGLLKIQGTENQNAGVIQGVGAAASSLRNAKIIQNHPKLRQTVGIFKRRVSKARRNAILAEFAKRQAASNVGQSEF